MECVHRNLQLATDYIVDVLDSVLYRSIDQCGFSFRRSFQNKIHDFLLLAGMTDAQSQAQVVGADMPGCVAQTIMAGCTATMLELDLAGWQIEFIMNHQYLFYGYAVIVGESTNRLTAVVHEGLGRQQADALTTYADFSGQ